MIIQPVTELPRSEHAAQVARVLAAETRDPRSWKDRPQPRVVRADFRPPTDDLPRAA